MDVVNEVKDILITLFQKTAKSNKVSVTDVDLCFQLKGNLTSYVCKYGSEVIDVSIAGLKAQLFKSKINDYITAALLKFSNSEKIDSRYTNIVMTYDDNSIIMVLRNGEDQIRQVTINDILN